MFSSHSGRSLVLHTAGSRVGQPQGVLLVGMLVGSSKLGALSRRMTAEKEATVGVRLPRGGMSCTVMQSVKKP